MKLRNLIVGLGFFGVFFATQGVAVLAIPYYQMTLKLDPFYLGICITLPMLIGALLSPSVGKLLDNNSAFKNKPRLIFVFGWLTAILFGLVWMAPVEWEKQNILTYVLAILIALAISLCFLTLALKCLVFDEFDSPIDRSTQFGVNAFFEKLGSIIYFWLFPLAYIIVQGSIQDGVRSIGWAISILIIGGFNTLLYLYYLNVQSPTDEIDIPKDIRQKAHKIAIPKVIKHQTYTALVHAFMMFAILGLCVSFDYYLIVYYMHDADVIAGSFWKGVLSTAYALFGIVYIPILLRLSKHKSSYVVLRYAYVVAFLGGPLKWLIFSPENDIFLIVDALFGAIAWAAIAMMIPSILGNISEQAEKNYSIKVHGWLNARHNLILLTSAVVSLTASGLLLKLTGFDAAATYQENAQPLQTIKYIFTFGTSSVFVLLFLLTCRTDRYAKLV